MNKSYVKGGNITKNKLFMRTKNTPPEVVRFTVLLNANHRVKLREEMNRWLEYCRGGDAETLIIGTGALGVDKWVVTSVSQHWDSIYNMGELVAGKVDVTLQEIVALHYQKCPKFPVSNMVLYYHNKFKTSS